MTVKPRSVNSSVPTDFQKKICWNALTALAISLLLALAALAIYLLAQAISFLQPVLFPLAVAILLAYLLEPLVASLCRRGLSRTLATSIVFLCFFLLASAILVSVLPAAWRQGVQFVQNFPNYSQKFLNLGISSLENLQNWHRSLLEPHPHPTAPTTLLTSYVAKSLEDGVAWLQARLPDFVLFLGRLLQRSIGGFLGAFLAVPLTAALKVIARRYLWEKTLPALESTPPLGRKTNPTRP